MTDEKSFIPFLVVGIIIFLLGIILIFTIDPAIRKWIELSLALVQMLAGNMQSAVVEAF
jgi:hypothetical protein